MNRSPTDKKVFLWAFASLCLEKIQSYHFRFDVSKKKLKNEYGLNECYSFSEKN